MAVQPADGDGPLLPGVSETSEATQRLVDAEVRRIIEEAHAEVRNLLERERDKLDALAEALLRDETLDEPDAYRAAGIERVAAPGLRLRSSRIPGRPRRPGSRGTRARRCACTGRRRASRVRCPT